MYRLAFAAFCLAATSAHAGDPNKYAHTHVSHGEVAGASFYEPINYRKHKVREVVRTRGYTEEPTIRFRGAGGLIDKTGKSPLLEVARASDDPTRSVVSVEEFD